MTSDLFISGYWLYSLACRWFFGIVNPPWRSGFFGRASVDMMSWKRDFLESLDSGSLRMRAEPRPSGRVRSIEVPGG